ncbi:MAG: ABC transporter permease [Chloroflexota bacterium]|nr:ABC transporter permease [Chloroflexota bacterium]
MSWLSDPANWSGRGGIPVRLWEHIALSGTSLLIALLIALPIGLWIGHARRGAGFAVNLANLGRALPSLAVIALIVPITAAIDPQLGFRLYPTLIAMVVLGIPPLLVNSYAGVAAVDAELVDAARGMGFRELQILGRIEVPLAVPVIVGGIRSAAVQIIATATLGAIFGSGGLGRFLVEGIAQNNEGMIFGGVVLVAALALTSELAFAILQRLLTPRGVAPAGSGLRAMVQFRAAKVLPPKF